MIEIATASFEASQPDDDACAAFWLAATDQLWTYGIEHAPTFARAQDLIRSGADLVAMRGLGMAEKDLARRAKALSDLSAKWAAPNPKPRGRKMMTEPEPFVFDEDAVVRYPTSAYAPINPYFPAKMIADWTQDGWGAFIILRHFRRLEFFAVSLIGFLLPRPIGLCGIDGFPTRDAVVILELVTLSPLQARKMRLEKIGQRKIDAERVAALPANRYPFVFAPQELANALTSHSQGTAPASTTWVKWNGDPENPFERDDAIPLSTLLQAGEGLAGR